MLAKPITKNTPTRLELCEAYEELLAWLLASREQTGLTPIQEFLPADQAFAVVGHVYPDCSRYEVAVAALLQYRRRRDKIDEQLSAGPGEKTSEALRTLKRVWALHACRELEALFKVAYDAQQRNLRGRAFTEFWEHQSRIDAAESS